MVVRVAQVPQVLRVHWERQPVVLPAGQDGPSRSSGSSCAKRASEILLDTSSSSCQSLALMVTGWLPTIVLAKPCNVSCCDAQPLTEQ